jgi:ankyrin repeat protein
MLFSYALQAKGQDGGSALLHAAAAGKREVVDLLLKQGADIDVKHVDGGTVLTEFAGEGWHDLVKQVRHASTLYSFKRAAC